MAVTIYDVAKKANVSVSTVSRVLNNTGSVHPQTKKLIQQIIEELNFKPNVLAQSLSNKNSKMIAVFLPHATDFYIKLIEGIEEAAYNEDYKVIVCFTQGILDREEKYLQFLQQWNVDGIVIASDFNAYKHLVETKIPYVLVDHEFFDEKNLNNVCITSDNVEGGRLAAKALIEKGRKNIVLFRGPSFLKTTIERTKGALEILEKHNIKPLIQDFDIISPELLSIKNFIEENKDIDGIFCFSDSIASTTIFQLQELGYKIPEDISIIGFDNNSYSKWIKPQLSTINQNIKLMGETAFYSIKKLIKGDEVSSTIIPVEYIERKSV